MFPTTTKPTIRQSCEALCSVGDFLHTRRYPYDPIVMGYIASFACRFPIPVALDMSDLLMKTFSLYRSWTGERTLEAADVWWTRKQRISQNIMPTEHVRLG